VFVDHSEDLVRIDGRQRAALKDIISDCENALRDVRRGASVECSGFIATHDGLKQGYLKIAQASEVRVEGKHIAVGLLGLVERIENAGSRPAPRRVRPEEIQLAVIVWRADEWLMRLRFTNEEGSKRDAAERARRIKQKGKEKNKKKKKKKKRPNRYIWKSFGNVVSGGLPSLGKRR